MAANARDVGERIEQLLAGLTAGRDKESADELVRLLVEMYGEGLARMIGLLAEHDPALVHRLAEDELVESLLLLHDLHPLDTDARIKRALGRLGTGAEFLGVDTNGVAHVRLGHGCGSTTAVVEQAIVDAAPETTGVEFAPREAPLLQITRRPAGAI